MTPSSSLLSDLRYKLKLHKDSSAILIKLPELKRIVAALEAAGTQKPEASAEVKLSDGINKMIRDHAIAVDELTMEQTAEPIRQMILAGDFKRYVHIRGGFQVAQAISYYLFAEKLSLKARIADTERDLSLAHADIAKMADELEAWEKASNEQIQHHNAQVNRLEAEIKRLNFIIEDIK